jgi:pyrimidine-specific ribonucleoside hydrolase
MAAPSVHGKSGLDGPDLPEPAVDLSPLTAVELMAELLRHSADPVWLVATGPLTNVATLLLAHPELTAKIAGISLMGGGIRSGNWTPAAEFNILADPEAAQIVFGSGVPIRQAGLDVTEQATVLPADSARMRAVGGPLAEVVADWVDYFFAFHRDLGYDGAPLHDPVAVVALTHPELLTTRDLFVEVETEGEYARGATVGDVHEASGCAPNARVAFGIDRLGYVDLLVDAIRRLTVDESQRPGISGSRPVGSVLPVIASGPMPAEATGSADVAARRGGWPTVIDCDPGTDDLAALIVARQLPSLDVRAVTVVAGNTDLEHATRNALGLVELLGWDVPVARGAAKPLTRDLVTAADIHGSDGLLGVELPVGGAADPRPAWQVMRDVAMVSEVPIDVVAVGPLTNVAIALATYPGLGERIRRVVVMGGGVEAGNTTAAAEFNTYVDPEAARRVFTSGVPFWLCPLDVTHQAYITAGELAQVRALGSPAAVLFADVIERYFPAVVRYAGGRGAPLHDPVAVAFAADDAAFGSVRCFVGVETRGVRTRGMTITDRYSDTKLTANGHLVETVERDRFVATIREALDRY